MLQREPIDRARVEASVRWPGAGAILTFEGVGRDHFEGRPVRGLVYEAYEEMARVELHRIEEEVAARWPGARVRIVHRLGEVGIGEASVVIAVGAAHRAEAYEASRHAIEALKARVPIWKKELYTDGEAWKANAP